MTDRRRRDLLKAAAATAVLGTIEWRPRAAAAESTRMKIGKYVL